MLYQPANKIVSTNYTNEFVSNWIAFLAWIIAESACMPARFGDMLDICPDDEYHRQVENEHGKYRVYYPSKRVFKMNQ